MIAAGIETIIKPLYKTVLKPYRGDIFGTASEYQNGMVYLSRMQADKSDKSKKTLPKIEEKEKEMEDEKPEELTAEINQDESMSASLKEMEAKQHCAATLCNWSRFAANTERLASDGAVHAVMRLSKEDNPYIRKHCAAAFRHMSTRSVLAQQLIQYGAVPVISDLANNSSNDKKIGKDCLISLINMTKNSGTEAKLVEDGIVLAISSMLVDDEQWDEMCARGLFNLTCVDTHYPLMERVIKAFMTLASSSFSSVKYLCAAALCNIADLKQMRMRVVEEGVIQVLGSLARGSDAKTRRLCAIILYSLSGNKGCRAEMASRGAVVVLYSLSTDNDMTTIYCIASAIYRLAQEDSNIGRLTSEGGINAVSGISIRCADISHTSQACAAAMHVLSKRTDHRSMFVQEGCIPALITLLKTSTDFLTLHYSVLSICNLLTMEENQELLTIIISQGGVQTIVELCRHEHEGIQKSCAFAIFTLSCVDAARKQAVQHGAIAKIIALSKVDDVDMQLFCAATLCMMSTDQDNIIEMVNNNAIETFIDLLQCNNPRTVRYCCAALCCLAYNKHSCMKLVEVGAIPHVIAGSMTGDITTRQSCCAVISALSTHKDARHYLCKEKVLPALKSLSSMEDPKTRLRCAVSFANLSCESIVQGVMVKEGVIPILAQLSNSYSEENQGYCAKALCNLACHSGSEKILVEQGGMKALMMICMVRTVNPNTKQICAKAILNLLTPETMPDIIEEGLITACSSLSKLSDETTLKACALLSCVVSNDSFGRKKLCEKVGALNGLFKLMGKTDEISTKIIVGNAICNLLSYLDSRHITVKYGGVAVLNSICMIGDPKAEKICAESFYRIIDDEFCRKSMITGAVHSPEEELTKTTANNMNPHEQELENEKEISEQKPQQTETKKNTDSQILENIIILARSPHPETQNLCVNILCKLAWYRNTRKELLRSNIVVALVALLNTEASKVDTNNHTLEICCRTLCYLSIDSENHQKIVEDSVLPAIIKIHKSGKADAKCYEIITVMIQLLSGTTSCLTSMASDGIIALLCHIVKVNNENSLAQYACAIALYRLSLLPALRERLVKEDVVPIMVMLANVEECREIVSATLYLLSLSPNTREELTECGVPLALKNLLLSEMEKENNTIQNCTAAVLMLSKSSKCRKSLIDAHIVSIMIKLSKSKNPKICDSCSQALNSLSAESGEGIEKGTVAALISIALDGNAASKTDIAAEDYLGEPSIADVNIEAYAPPDNKGPEEDFSGYTISYVKMEGGSAGKGPKPPQPPSIADDKTQVFKTVPGSSEEVSNTGGLAIEDEAEDESSSVERVMMFAKMDPAEKFLGGDATSNDKADIEGLLEQRLNKTEPPPSDETFLDIDEPKGKKSQKDVTAGVTRATSLRDPRKSKSYRETTKSRDKDKEKRLIKNKYRIAKRSGGNIEEMKSIGSSASASIEQDINEQAKQLGLWTDY